MEGIIDIKKLTLAELAGVVNIYPWFASARKELFTRMNAAGTWSGNRWCDVSMYLADMSVLGSSLRAGRDEDCSDNDVQELLDRCIDQKQQEDRPRVVVVGGDYFTQAEYDRIRSKEDNVFFGYTYSPKAEDKPSVQDQDDNIDFCTETLAGIYAEQGYYQKAREIYSKLILAYPEKNTYFAALIEKLNQSIL